MLATGAISLCRGGRVHHIGIGRGGEHVRLLINNPDIGVVNETTGELLGALTLDPNRDYQPRLK